MILPAQLTAVRGETRDVGFPKASETATGQRPRMPAACKPHGRLLELGTGLASSWLLDGIDAMLLSVDNDDSCQVMARAYPGHERRVTFVLDDGAAVIRRLSHADQRYDLIFADTWPGTYTDLDLALELLAPGGLYVVDNMPRQPNWQDGHAPRAAASAAVLLSDSRLATTRLDRSNGLIIALYWESSAHG